MSLIHVIDPTPGTGWRTRCGIRHFNFAVAPSREHTATCRRCTPTNHGGR